VTPGPGTREPGRELPTESVSPHRSSGRLHVLLGIAPGAGKTFSMLDEGRRLAESGRDVVVGLAETHG